ncbi:MAG: TonB-dependent receptor [Tenacibaculum sp.]
MLKKKLFIFFTLLSSCGIFYAQQISLNFKDKKLETIFSEINKQTGYVFSYSTQVVNTSQRVTIKVKNQSLKEVLAQIFKGKNISFEITGNKKILLTKHINTTNSYGQRVIRGVVKDAFDEPLPGISIIEQGTTNGTTTDFDGNFVLNTAKNAELEISSLGYKTQKIAVKQRTEFQIQLEEENSQLEEVVVIGYGKSQRQKFNGAVSQIKAKALNNFSSANFEQALAGNISGVQVLGNTKNPGENSVIQIRGLNTLTAGTNPLIVVDGFPLTEGSSFSSINTQDIESVNILKDAASASIYGSRASNGVILITTKKGKTSNLKVSYDGYVGIQKRIDNFKLVDAYDNAIYDYDARNFGYISGGNDRNIEDDNATRDKKGNNNRRSRIPTYLQAYLDKQPGLTNTNWANEVFRPAVQQNHYINLSGRNKKTNYSFSLGYLNQENIVALSDYKRYTSSININGSISNWARVGISSNISLSNSNPTGQAGWSIYSLDDGLQPDPSFSIILMQPYYPVYNDDGTYAISHQLNDNNENWDSPISENTLAQTALSDFFERRFRVFGNTYLEIEPIKNLKLKTSFGGDYNSAFTEFFAPNNFGNYRTPIEANITKAFERNASQQNFISENTLSYKTYIGEHNFEILLGFSYQQENLFNTKVIADGGFTDNLIRNVSGSTKTTSVPLRSKWALVSYFSRLQYEFANKYSLAVSFRQDGSSRFGKNTKFGNFSSFSAGWTISNEAFFPGKFLIQFAKLRFSWGQTGNNQIGNFGSIALVDADNYVYNNELTSGSFTSTSPNPNLSWETNTAINLGLDLGLLNNKISIIAEYYQSNTIDLLLEVPVPEQSGFQTSLRNLGKLKNTGLEFEINGKDFLIGNIKLGFNANISANSNEVLALADGQSQIIESVENMSFITQIGSSIAQFYAYDIAGVYKNQQQIDNDPITPLKGTEIGDYIVRDTNGDGVINTNDRITLGDYNPDFTYGFGFNFEYKGLDLNAQFTGIKGRKVSDRMLLYGDSGEGFFMPTQYYFDNYFSDRNPNGFFRRPDFSSFSSAGRLTRASNLSVYNADYFRLRSLQLGYSLPQKIIFNSGLDKLRMYITGNNIFNISSYRGYNPDAIDVRTNKSQTLTRGWIQSASPLTRFIALGVNITF